MKRLQTSLPVEILLKYREFDRVAKPRPEIGFMPQETIESLTELIKVNGLTESLELVKYKNLALLTEGNHRIAVARNLNYSFVPVEVVVLESEEELRTYLYQHSVDRLKINLDFEIEA